MRLYVHVGARVCLHGWQAYRKADEHAGDKNKFVGVKHYCKCQHVYFQEFIINILNSHRDLWAKQQLIKSALILGKWAAAISNCETYVLSTVGPVQPWFVNLS